MRDMQVEIIEYALSWVQIGDSSCLDRREIKESYYESMPGVFQLRHGNMPWIKLVH